MLPMLALAGGAALGGLAKGLFGGGGLTGKREQFKQVPLYNTQQQQAMSSMLGQGMQNADFGNIENREVNRFQTQTIPSLAERFTSMGGSGQRSSGFQNALGMAGSDLGQQLAALRSQFGLQQMSMGLRPQFENAYMPRQAGGIEQALGGLSNFLPMAMMSPGSFGMGGQGLYGGGQQGGQNQINLQQLLQMLPMVQGGGLQTTQAYQ